MLSYFIVLISTNSNKIVLRNINQFDRANVFLFVWVNLMCSTTLIWHLKYLELTKEGVEINEIIKKLKDRERSFLITAFVIYFIISIIIIIMTVIELVFKWRYDSDFEYGDHNTNNLWFVSFILQWIMSTSKTVAFGVFALFELVLYIKLKFFLNGNLNWYYIKIKPSLIVMVISSMTYFIGVIILDIIKYIYVEFHLKN